MAKFKSDGKVWEPENKAAKEYVAKTSQKYSQAVKDEVNFLRAEAKKRVYDIVFGSEQAIEKLLKYGFKAAKDVLKKEKKDG